MNELTRIVKKHLSAYPGVRILWNHRVTSAGQDGEKAWVDVETPNGPQQLDADYIVGCDGGQSIVRRSLFGDKAMPGFTWDKNVIAADVGSSSWCTSGGC